MRLLPKKDQNIIPREDKTLENAVEMKDGRLVVIGERMEDSVHTEFYRPVKGGYSLTAAMHVCLSKLPELLKSGFENIPSYETCHVNKKDIHQCEECYLSRFG